MRELQLLVASAGIFFSFSFFAVLQEDVYKKEYDGQQFTMTLFAILIERTLNAVIALVALMALGGSKLKLPVLDMCNSGVTQSLAMAASNEALRYVSYPTQVLGKSSKMVPVMAGGVLVGGKKYTSMEYLQVFVITLGVCVFNFGKPRKGKGTDSNYGLLFIAISLTLDAVTGGLQDRAKVSCAKANPSVPKAKPSTYESMFYTNLAGAGVGLFLSVVTGQFHEGIAFCIRSPAVLEAIVAYSLCSAVGNTFVYYTITHFNPLVLTTVTTTRKIFSTVYSVLRSPQNSLNGMQWSGCLLVFVGLFFDIARKYAGSQPKANAAKKAS